MGCSIAIPQGYRKRYRLGATDTYYAGDTALWEVKYSSNGVTSPTTREEQLSVYLGKGIARVYYLADGETTYRDPDGTEKTVPLFILNNTCGAGKTVLTQEDRAVYYQTFALKMLEAGYCVGWTWYRYQDNDMTIYWDTQEEKYVENSASLDTSDTDRYVVIRKGDTDQSNLDSQKGIVDNAMNVYTEFAEGILSISKNAYALADFFDATRR